MALPLLVVAAQVARMGVQGAIRSGLGKAAIKKAQTEFKKRFGKNLTKGTKVPKSTPRDDTAKMIADDIGRRSSKRMAKGERRVATQGNPPATVGSKRVAKGERRVATQGNLPATVGGRSAAAKGNKLGTAATVAAGLGSLGAGDKKQETEKTTTTTPTSNTGRSPSSDATAKTKAKKDSANATAGVLSMAKRRKDRKAKKDSANATAGVLSMAKRRKDRKAKAAKQPDYMKYNNIAEAKKAGSNFYSKDGKKMAAVFKEDLAQGESLRDYMNKKTGKTRKASNTPLTELSLNKDGTPADPKEFNKRVKDGTTLVNKRKGGGVKKLMAGGMTKSAYKAGGKLNMVKGKDGKMVPDYAADGVGKMKKGGGVKKMKKMNMGGMAGMDDAAMMAMKKKRKKPMMPAQQAMSSGAAMPMMKKGGTAKKKASKPRGYGMARGGKACKMR
tara:strand:- start:3381 stop:4712 length:1332 start_codon:yes stop_codon:yes gene_type:complete